MVCVCAYPNCAKKMLSHTSLKFSWTTSLGRDTLKVWLVMLQMDENTPVLLRLADHRV